MIPHAGVHGRRHQDRFTREGNGAGGYQIIGGAMRQLGNGIYGGGHNKQGIRLLGNHNVNGHSGMIHGQL